MVELSDGRVITADPRTPRGDTDMPLSDQEISEKFHLFADPVVGKPRADKIETLTSGFDTLTSAEFSQLCTACLSTV